MRDESGRVFVIAEAGVNHNGSLDLARQLVDVAAAAGADAVKFQTFSADKLVLKSAARADYQIRNTGDSGSQHAMLKKLEMPNEMLLDLCARAKAAGIEFMSSPFDPQSVDLLANTVGVRRLKIPSGEVINAFLLIRAWHTGLPLILSSGMCTLEEILDSLALLVWAEKTKGYTPPPSAALAAIRAAQDDWCAPLRGRVTLLQCVTQYPAPAAATNLRAMATLHAATGLPCGFSDHSEGRHVAVAAVALGACVVEKHFTVSRDLPGPDHAASLEPDELAAMIREIRDVESALGDGVKVPNPVEIQNRLPARGSIVAARSILRGTPFAAEDLAVKRPGNGISPLRGGDLVGARAGRDYAPDEQIDAHELPA